MTDDIDPQRKLNQAHRTDERGHPLRPDMARLRYGMDAHQAAAYIEHLEDIAHHVENLTVTPAKAHAMFDLIDVVDAYLHNEGPSDATSVEVERAFDRFRELDADPRLRTGYPVRGPRPRQVDDLPGLEIEVEVERGDGTTETVEPTPGLRLVEDPDGEH